MYVCCSTYPSESLESSVSELQTAGHLYGGELVAALSEGDQRRVGQVQAPGQAQVVQPRALLRQTYHRFIT